MPEAFDRMRGHGGPTAAGLADLVSSATGHPGPWPTISVWHGSADTTVDASNADAIIEQWRPFHGVGSSPDTLVEGNGFRRRSWQDKGDRTVIEDWRIAGMGHGTPVSSSGADACGTGGPYMLDVGISSTREIARSWGLGRRSTSRTAARCRRIVAIDIEHRGTLQVSIECGD
jgi:poly(3-hydroxybutyrate) depolymerase